MKNNITRIGKVDSNTGLVYLYKLDKPINYQYKDCGTYKRTITNFLLFKSRIRLSWGLEPPSYFDPADHVLSTFCSDEHGEEKCEYRMKSIQTGTFKNFEEIIINSHWKLQSNTLSKSDFFIKGDGKFDRKIGFGTKGNKLLPGNLISFTAGMKYNIMSKYKSNLDFSRIKNSLLKTNKPILLLTPIQKSTNYKNIIFFDALFEENIVTFCASVDNFFLNKPEKCL